MDAQLDLRVRQLHEAMGQIRSSDLSTIRPYSETVGNWHYCGVDFNGDATDAQLANIVSLSIANIACLRDHLKAWCNFKNVPFTGDTLINTNGDAAIIHDLWNRDKHYDLKQSRSGLFPQLTEIKRSARMTVGGDGPGSVSMQLDPGTGQLIIHKSGCGKMELVVDAKIVDRTGNQVGLLIDVSENAVNAWEQTLVAAGVSLPSRNLP
jgi:hypothetical protein